MRRQELSIVSKLNCAIMGLKDFDSPMPVFVVRLEVFWTLLKIHFYGLKGFYRFVQTENSYIYPFLISLNRTVIRLKE
jgi:hypothetical protein